MWSIFLKKRYSKWFSAEKEHRNTHMSSGLLMCPLYLFINYKQTAFSETSVCQVRVVFAYPGFDSQVSSFSKVFFQDCRHLFVASTLIICTIGHYHN